MFPGQATRRPEFQCIASMLPGMEDFRHAFFRTRAANRLLNGKELRVFSVALDGMWRDLMSRVHTEGNPKRVSGFELWYRNHCNPTLETFAPRTRNIGNSNPIGSMSRRQDPGQAMGCGAFNRSHTKTRRGGQLDAGQSGNGQMSKLHGCVETAKKNEDSGLCGAVQYRSPGHTFPDKRRILCRCDGGR